MELELHDAEGEGLKQWVTRRGFMENRGIGIVNAMITGIYYLISTIIIEPGRKLPLV